ncbi:MAG: hypothetical protein WDO06_02385 [Actinomycetota bacterium]
MVLLGINFFTHHRLNTHEAISAGLKTVSSARLVTHFAGTSEPVYWLGAKKNYVYSVVHIHRGDITISYFPSTTNFRKNPEPDMSITTYAEVDTYNSMMHSIQIQN